MKSDLMVKCVLVVYKWQKVISSQSGGKWQQVMQSERKWLIEKWLIDKWLKVIQWCIVTKKWDKVIVLWSEQKWLEVAESGLTISDRTLSD